MKMKTVVMVLQLWINKNPLNYVILNKLTYIVCDVLL
jgi:hypothetical protein